MISLMARPKTTPRKPPFIVRSHTITYEDDTLLRHLSRDATDALGWSVSSSAIVRALIRYAEQQPAAWAAAALHPLIEQEIASGTIWGSKKK
jgi:hypothetical protein